MIHVNAPLTPAGRLRLVERIEAGRPIAHVAAEAGIARATASKWVHRYRADGVAGLDDRCSSPVRRPTRLSVEVIELIDSRRQESINSMTSTDSLVGRRTGELQRSSNPATPSAR